jgi:hypothetical protein
MGARISSENGSGDHEQSRTSDPLRDLSRENREGHERVQETLREAERIANTPPPDPARTSAH